MRLQVISATRTSLPVSMGPKVEAACTFVENTGRRATIGALEDIQRMVAGEAGTVIEP